MWLYFLFWWYICCMKRRKYRSDKSFSHMDRWVVSLFLIANVTTWNSVKCYGKIDDSWKIWMPIPLFVRSNKLNSYRITCTQENLSRTRIASTRPYKLCGTFHNKIHYQANYLIRDDAPNIVFPSMVELAEPIDLVNNWRRSWKI